MSGPQGPVHVIVDPTGANGALVDASGALHVNVVAGGGGGGGSSAPYQVTQKGYQQYASLAASTPLASIPSGATYAIIQAEGQDVRWRDDGTAPTATVGMILYAGQVMTFSGDLTTLHFIQVAAGGILNVSYYA